ncbi:MAG: hypothetical protein NZ772_07750 [Cyanobacteria bacterium]|nr:hypothetical protein [Cyanobacteriota bacterium]MDW8201409.1 hypothetical protein [Cyanobacteriota bacterium SKYGB_h_bin112]
MVKVLSQTPTQLVLGDPQSFGSKVRDTIIIAVLISGVVTGVGWLTGRQMQTAGKLRTLMCDRIEPTQVNCTLTERGVDGTSTTTIPKLRGARFASTRHIDDEGNTYYLCQVWLVNHQGLHTIPLRQFNYRTDDSTCANAQAVVAQINQLAKTPSVKLATYQEDTRLDQNILQFAATVGGVLLGVILAIFLLPLRQITWVYDRSQQRLAWIRQTIFGKTTIYYPFSQLQTIKVSLWRDSEDDPRGSVEVTLKQPSGKVKSLEILPSGLRNEDSCRELSAAIHAITDIPVDIDNKL